MRIAEYRMDEQFQNCQFLESNFNFSNWKKISKFLNFLIWTIPNTSNLENSKNFKFGKFKKISIWKFFKIVDFGNTKNFQFGKFQNCKLKNSKNSQWGKFQKFPEYSNFEKRRIF